MKDPILELIADIAESSMGARAKGVFSIFLVLAMLLVIAVFGVVAAKTLIAQPQMVFPTLAIIPVSPRKYPAGGA